MLLQNIKEELNGKIDQVRGSEDWMLLRCHFSPEPPAILTKIMQAFYVELDKIILKFIWDCRTHNKEKQSRGPHATWFSTHYKAAGLKILV